MHVQESWAATRAMRATSMVTVSMLDVDIAGVAAARVRRARSGNLQGKGLNADGAFETRKPRLNTSTNHS